MNIIIEAIESLTRKIKILRRKRMYKIRKSCGRYNIYFYGGPLDRNGFPTKKAARQRLREYFSRVSWSNI